MLQDDDLPDDDLLAFLQLETEFRSEFEKAIEGIDGNSEYQHVADEYMNKAIAAAQALNIEALASHFAPRGDSGNGYETVRDFKRDVDNITVQARILLARRKKTMSVSFSSEQKARMHGFIAKIRGEIEKSLVQADKKDKLFEMLGRLDTEIDQDRTKFERIGDLARGLAGLSRDVAEEGAEPWWKWFRLFLGEVDDVKESEPKLPKPVEVQRIEPPRKQIPKANLDDEIPF